MSEMRPLLADTAARVFTRHCTRELLAAAEAGSFPSPLWQAIEAAGLATASIAEDKGGSGADLGDVMAILRAAGHHAAPVPLAETLLAAWIFSESGFAVPPGPLTIAPVLRGELPALHRDGAGWRLEGRARFVPWARDCAEAAVLAYDGRRLCVAQVALLPAMVAPGRNLAGEPRDEVDFADLSLAAARVAPAGTGIDFDALWRRGALARTTAMAGALEQVLALTVGYAMERQQFGRPIGKFQAVQQQIAVLAAQVAAAGAATDAAIAAAERGPAGFEIAAAKARIGEAATLVAAIAHQVHGAMGFTREHRLHLSTRRLWAWREEFGDETYWRRWLGRGALKLGGEGLWPFLTGSDKTPPIPL
jgi:acyl-CoA dehydrogenase